MAPTNSAGTPFTLLTADGTVLTLRAGDRAVIQNHDDAALYWKLGADCSTSSYSGILPACVAALDGTSPPLVLTNWAGDISVAAATGTPRLTAWKI